MTRPGSKLALVVVALAVTVAAAATAPRAGPTTGVIRVAIMTDCSGPFGLAYEATIGGAQSALAQYAGGRVVNPADPSAGVTGLTVAGRRLLIVGYGCGDASASRGLIETTRLMEELDADVMIGPLTGDEASGIARYAVSHPTKTFILGTAGSQDPTLQIAPENVFRYHGDDVQRNAGLGALAYERLGWRRAVLVVDDNSLGWTSAAGIVADFCAIGGKIMRRVYVPPSTTDYSSSMGQLLPPGQIDGYFWVVGPAGMPAALKAFAERYGRLDPSRHVVDEPLASGTDYDSVPHQLVGAYAGGLGTAPDLRTKQAKAYRAVVARWYPGLSGGTSADPFVYDYFNAAWAFVRGLRSAGGDLAKLAASMPRTSRSGYEVSDRGLIRLDGNRQAVEDEYPLQIVKGAHGKLAAVVAAQVPDVDQSFGGLFTKTSPPPGRTQPPCSKRRLPWQGKIRIVRAGVVTPEPIG